MNINDEFIDQNRSLLSQTPTNLNAFTPIGLSYDNSNESKTDNILY